MNPRLVDNGIYSQSHHASRDDLRNALDDKRVNFLETPEFWTKLLLTESVSSDTVESIHKATQPYIKQLVHIAASKNPAEIEMYPPLDKVFKVIQKQSEDARFWKDHHTKYPGVDSGVFVSGLYGKDPASTQVSSAHSQKTDGSRHVKRIKVEAHSPDYTHPKGSEEDESSDEDNDSYRPRKLPSQFAQTLRIFDTRKPDYLLLDADYHGRCPKKPLWRQAAVIMELKAQSSCAPSPANPESSLIVQCTDYARLHMALRPFQRFSILFTLCGTIFTGWLIDRVGVIISENVDISKPDGAYTFIRAMMRVTCSMTIHDLGMDPTVFIHGDSAMGDTEIPSFVVSMPSNNAYITKGIPIWQSSSVFGRGTVVWNVNEKHVTSQPTEAEVSEPSEAGSSIPPGPTLILKNAYRGKQRIGESEFYRAIQRAKIEGLAVFREGGDVNWTSKSQENQGIRLKTSAVGDAEVSERTTSKDRMISASLHRANLNVNLEEDSIAHRLVLESKGKRLSEHDDLCGLLKAVLSCVKGHESLYEHGILHRDISIGNVFISDAGHSNSNAAGGFLADLDMAKVHDEAKLAQLIGKKMAKSLIKLTTESITGTAQFMSLPLLKHHAYAQELKRPKVRPAVKGSKLPEWKSTPVTQSSRSVGNNPQDDLESFVWTLFYALCVKEMNSHHTAQSRDHYCKTYFVKIFGALSFNDTYEQHLAARQRILGDDPSDKLWREDRISEGDAWVVLRALMRAAKDEDLDYKEFKNILEHYIALLEPTSVIPQTK
ncbi:hypothetical protein M408DRAFT_235220 [Serendipita vermifera MAFF 305830]|uniref:Fungal-type protein kinase domain-containing protein n=1 Tax=Serendipita vermifera MAFF 305830 TaxID=933852 RepID=A0A0C2WZV7_SERVB|nr:hypothetical protein M408DRAFT_235220 [Serendipita vermifera MAFF 305830]